MLKKYKKEITISASWAIFLYILFSVVLMLSTITSGSMEPSLMTGDICIYNRLAYLSSTPERGDIVAFNEIDSGDIYAKRVVGVPGNLIEFYDGYVYINGVLLDESAYLEIVYNNGCGWSNLTTAIF